MYTDTIAFVSLLYGVGMRLDWSDFTSNTAIGDIVFDDNTR